ncbi:recombinase family protein [Erythrobacter sp.]|uniref:recombinase family protein n=1 Tax=Erythrobacter sp. TaxID=1042 RepID=UPI0032EBA2D1
MIAQLSAKPVGLRCVQQKAVDTNTSIEWLILGILGAAAELETDLLRDRNCESIERAKAASVHMGCKRIIDAAEVRSLPD